MSQPEPEIIRTKIDIPFRADEEARYRQFLERTGRTKSGGPWVRTVILQAMAEEEAARPRAASQ